jgi:hypothetical protein
MRSVAQQSGRKLTPAIPATGKGNVEIQGHQNPAKVRRDDFKKSRVAALAQWRELAA